MTKVEIIRKAARLVKVLGYSIKQKDITILDDNYKSLVKNEDYITISDSANDVLYKVNVHIGTVYHKGGKSVLPSFATPEPVEETTKYYIAVYENEDRQRCKGYISTRGEDIGKIEGLFSMCDAPEPVMSEEQTDKELEKFLDRCSEVTGLEAPSLHTVKALLTPKDDLNSVLRGFIEQFGIIIEEDEQEIHELIAAEIEIPETPIPEDYEGKIYTGQKIPPRNQKAVLYSCNGKQLGVYNIIKHTKHIIQIDSRKRRKFSTTDFKQLCSSKREQANYIVLVKEGE